MGSGTAAPPRAVSKTPKPTRAEVNNILASIPASVSASRVAGGSLTASVDDLARETDQASEALGTVLGLLPKLSHQGLAVAMAAIKDLIVPAGIVARMGTISVLSSRSGAPMGFTPGLFGLKGRSKGGMKGTKEGLANQEQVAPADRGATPLGRVDPRLCGGGHRASSKWASLTGDTRLLAEISTEEWYAGPPGGGSQELPEGDRASSVQAKGLTGHSMLIAGEQPVPAELEKARDAERIPILSS